MSPLRRFLVALGLLAGCESREQKPPQPEAGPASPATLSAEGERLRDLLSQKGIDASSLKPLFPRGEKVTSFMALKACHSCGLIHRLPPLQNEQAAVCVRCRTVLHRPAGARRSAARTAAAALGALALFWPAILLPVLEIEQLGHRYQSSILWGTIELLRKGSWLVGGVVLFFSIVFPLLKLLFLLELSLLGVLHRRHKALTYRLMEHAGKWSMMDVLLLAFLVMLVKLGNLVTFHFGPAVVAFIMCVVMSMAASLSFDPHWIWEEEE